MRTAAVVLCLVAAAGLALVPAGTGVSQEQKPQAELPKPLVIPDEEKNRKNPVEASKESLETGRKLFASQCALCHGEKGDGKGELAADMQVPVPDFIHPAEAKKRTDGELFYILTTGHGEMPGQGERLHDDQKWHLINFLRTLPAPEKPAPEPPK